MVELKREAQEFLLYSYFGITEADMEDLNKLMNVCAQKAYLDLCRTLKFKNKKKDHADFRDKVCNIVCEGVKKLLSTDASEFDEAHRNCCKKIRDTAIGFGELKEDFTPGHAQKWLNMTLKYMWLLGKWDNRFIRLLPVLHVPVDRYIMEAAATPREEKPYGCGLNLPSGKGGEGPYSFALSWSNWKRNEYEVFQCRLRNKLREEGLTPIEWEGAAWIETAKKHHKK